MKKNKSKGKIAMLRTCSKCKRPQLLSSYHKDKKGRFGRSLRCPGKVKVAMDHIASKFVEGMSWDNHGKWHILQPLWARDNLVKGGRMSCEKEGQMALAM